MNQSPDISVVLPIYNSGTFLQEAVQSVQRQSHRNFECLLCDASDDGSSDFLAKLCQEDPRFIWIKQPKMSLPESLQEGVSLAKAPLIARMDADDISLPHRFEKQLAIMKAQEDLVLLGTWIRYIDERGKFHKIAPQPCSQDIKEKILWGCPIAHPSVVFRKDAVLSAGGYRHFFTRAEDYDLWLRLLSVGRLDNLQEVQLLYRLHGDNSVCKGAAKNRELMMIAQALYLLQQKQIKIPFEVDCIKNVDDVLCFLDSADSFHVKSRMIAHSAHFLGDAGEDIVAQEWLSEIKKRKLDSTVRKAVAIFYLRCAKKYFSNSKRKSLSYISKAAMSDFKETMCQISLQVCSLGK